MINAYNMDMLFKDICDIEKATIRDHLLDSGITKDVERSYSCQRLVNTYQYRDSVKDVDPNVFFDFDEDAEKKGFANDSKKGLKKNDIYLSKKFAIRTKPSQWNDNVVKLFQTCLLNDIFTTVKIPTYVEELFAYMYYKYDPQKNTVKRILYFGRRHYDYASFNLNSFTKDNIIKQGQDYFKNKNNYYNMFYHDILLTQKEDSRGFDSLYMLIEDSDVKLYCADNKGSFFPATTRSITMLNGDIRNKVFEYFAFKYNNSFWNELSLEYIDKDLSKYSHNVRYFPISIPISDFQTIYSKKDLFTQKFKIMLPKTVDKNPDILNSMSLKMLYCIGCACQYVKADEIHYLFSDIPNWTDFGGQVYWFGHKITRKFIAEEYLKFYMKRKFGRNKGSIYTNYEEVYIPNAIKSNTRIPVDLYYANVADVNAEMAKKIYDKTPVKRFYQNSCFSGFKLPANFKKLTTIRDIEYECNIRGRCVPKNKVLVYYKLTLDEKEYFVSVKCTSDCKSIKKTYRIDWCIDKAGKDPSDQVLNYITEKIKKAEKNVAVKTERKTNKSEKFVVSVDDDSDVLIINGVEF